MPWQEVSIMSQRLEFVTLATAPKANIRHLCRCFGISSATAYKWLQRFQAVGRTDWQTVRGGRTIRRHKPRPRWKL